MAKLCPASWETAVLFTLSEAENPGRYARLWDRNTGNIPDTRKSEGERRQRWSATKLHKANLLPIFQLIVSCSSLGSEKPFNAAVSV